MPTLFIRLPQKTGLLLCLYVLLGMSPTAQAQPLPSGSFLLKGQVFAEGKPLPGAVVLVKGSENQKLGATATLTDNQGRFELPVQKGEELLISFMGYQSQTYTVATQTQMQIHLIPEVTNLHNIVINAGYYEVEQRKNTGSIAKITAQDIELQPIVNPLQALQGRLAGVNITQGTGIAGGGFHIEIRGRNSLRATFSSANKPLYLLDGMPLPEVSGGIESSDLSYEILQRNFSIFNNINPSDIASIEILKDADATAIYGSRGANGVILITTKKGLPGRTRFTLSSNTGFSKVPRYMDMLSTPQYLQMREDAFANAGIYGTSAWPMAHDLNGNWEKNRYTNWQKELIGGTAIDQSIQLGISGGNALTRFNANLAHSENGTVFPDSRGFTRNSVSLNFSHQSANNKFKWNAATAYSLTQNQLPATDLTSSAFKLAPNAPALYNPDGSLNWQNGTFVNPLAPLVVTYHNQSRLMNLNMGLAYEFAPKWVFRLNAGLTTNRMDEQRLSPHTRFNPALGYTSSRSSSDASNNLSDSYLIEPQLHWENQWGAHEIKALIGGSFQSDDRSNFQMNGSGFSSNAFLTNIALAQTKTIRELDASQYKYTALFARLNYSFQDRYILNLTGRRDGSSRFGPDKRFGNFGAVGAAWVFSNMEWSKAWTWLSFGKLRSSYGITGSDNIGDYAYLDTYTSLTTGYDGIASLSPSRLLNPDYSWETTHKLEAALEWGLWDNRLNGTLAWYQNRSSNQLIQYPLPATTGFPSITRNSVATIQNSGWELSLVSQNIQSPDWQWSSSFNISFPKNKLLAYPGLENSTQQFSYSIGKTINFQRMYHYEGLDPLTGIYEVTDYDQNNFYGIEDMRSFQPIETEFHGGFQNNIRYKNWSLDFLVQFVKQTQLQPDALFGSFLFGSQLQNYPVSWMDYWSPQNTDANYALPLAALNVFDLPSIYKLLGIAMQSDRTMGDASYLRLKSAALSYTFSLKRSKLESLRLYLSGQNLYTWTQYPGLDPEFITIGNLPPLRSFSFGMQLTF